MGQHLPGSTEDKKQPVNAKEHRFDPCSGKIPQVMEQLSPCVTTAEPVHLLLMFCDKRSHDSEKPPHHNYRIDARSP